MKVSVAKISMELGFGYDVVQPDGTIIRLPGIKDVLVPETITTFNPVLDGQGNVIISMETAIYLEENQYEEIEWVPPEPIVD